MPRRVTVIINSTAGSGCPPARVAALRAQFLAAGLQADIKEIRQGGSLPATVKGVVDAGVSTVVACGGDGTVSAVASGIVGTEVALGVIPLGTLNHFAKDLGIPLDEKAAIANVAAGFVLEVDVGEVNGRIFINNSSLGLYPDIVRERERRQRRLGYGKWRALLEASINAARRYPVLSVQIDLESKTYERRTPFVFVGNNRYTMEGFEIGERQALDRGELALYVTQHKGRFGLLELALRALFKRLDQARDFDVITTESFVVHTHHRQLQVATDGEVTSMQTPLRYQSRPKALRVIAPGRKT